MSRITLSLVLRADAVANVAGGLLLVALAGRIAPLAGLASRAPVVVLAVVLLSNGVANALVERRPTRAGVAGLVAVDLAFAVAVTAVALVDPTGAEPGLRWALAGLADLSLMVGAAKVWRGRASNAVLTAP